MSKCACECIRLNAIENTVFIWPIPTPRPPIWALGQIHWPCVWINNIKKGLFNGSLFPRDKCGLNTEASNEGGDFDVWLDPEIICARGVMCFVAWATWGYWQDVGCCLPTFMQEMVFGLRGGRHLHVFDALLRLIHMSGLGSTVQSSP